MDEPSAERDIERGLAAAAPRMGAGATTVEGLKRLTAGATQEVWRFELVAGETRTPLILRRAPGGTRPPGIPGICSDILVIVAENDTIEAGQCILGQNGEREVAGHQMGGDGVVARTAVAD